MEPKGTSPAAIPGEEGELKELGVEGEGVKSGAREGDESGAGL